MLITASELKANIGRYLDEIIQDDVYITRNGKIVAKLSSATQDKQAILDSLVGIAADNPLTLEEARAERLARQ
ncbi:type II toxin-antitoxin system Phd/YefM family antitoxin [Treponema primitia]|uniref:type II toxin-antitoxin system Phd/YefM family antitoxin n=1 Tax=Treponema primitia TaxID=88058 RepID=UPI00025551A2|nr:type II toxin-antitoxin system Phd/YefM family antitoxin [Treponema primitia]